MCTCQLVSVVALKIFANNLAIFEAVVCSVNGICVSKSRVLVSVVALKIFPNSLALFGAVVCIVNGISVGKSCEIVGVVALKIFANSLAIFEAVVCSVNGLKNLVYGGINSVRWQAKQKFSTLACQAKIQYV